MEDVWQKMEGCIGDVEARLAEEAHASRSLSEQSLELELDTTPPEAEALEVSDVPEQASKEAHMARKARLKVFSPSSFPLPHPHNSHHIHDFIECWA